MVLVAKQIVKYLLQMIHTQNPQTHSLWLSKRGELAAEAVVVALSPLVLPQLVVELVEEVCMLRDLLMLHQ